MSCCGSKRQQVVAAALPTAGIASAAASSGNVARAPGPPGVMFVYDGVAGLVVSGRVTGRRYRFTERGARLVVDPLDAPHVDGTPKLRRA
jgi:hypothetical protein